MKVEEDNLFYNVVGDELRVGWFADEGSVQIKAGEPVFVIRGRTTNDFRDGDVIHFKIANNPLCEFADGDGEVIENVVLKTSTIEYRNTGIFDKSSDLMDEFVIFPNPANNSVNISYSINKNSQVKISLYNLIGEKVQDLIDEKCQKTIQKIR